MISSPDLPSQQYPAEIMPTSIRPTGMAVSYMTQHIMIIVLVQTTPLALKDISWRFFLIFVCSSAIFSVVFVLFYPETRHKTLEEIEAIFGDKVSAAKSPELTISNSIVGCRHCRNAK